MFSNHLEQAVSRAVTHARGQRHEWVTVEHLLLALLDDPSVIGCLQALSVDLELLREDLSDIVDRAVPTVPPGKPYDTQPEPSVQRVLQRAVSHVQSGGLKEVSGANVLVAIFGEKDRHAVHFLTRQGVTRLDVINHLHHGISKQADEPRRRDRIELLEARLEKIEARLAKIEEKLGE